MIKVHQTNFMPGHKTSIDKNFVNKIFVMIMFSNYKNYENIVLQKFGAIRYHR